MEIGIGDRLHELRRRHVAMGIALLVAMAVLGVGSESLAQSNPPSEYQLKAAFLFNFAKFVDWPPGAFASADAPIHLCVWGEDPFGSDLDDIVRGKKINDRKIAAYRIQKLEELRSCQIAFVPGQDETRLQEILDGLRGVSTLVVGESPEFAARGGEIQFFIEDNRVRFSINIDAAQRAHLTVSAKLLALAKIVRDGNRARGG